MAPEILTIDVSAQIAWAQIGNFLREKKFSHRWLPSLFVPFNNWCLFFSVIVENIKDKNQAWGQVQVAKYKYKYNYFSGCKYKYKYWVLNSSTSTITFGQVQVLFAFIICKGPMKRHVFIYIPVTIM